MSSEQHEVSNRWRIGERHEVGGGLAPTARNAAARAGGRRDRDACLDARLAHIAAYVAEEAAMVRRCS